MIDESHKNDGKASFVAVFLQSVDTVTVAKKEKRVFMAIIRKTKNFATLECEKMDT